MVKRNSPPRATRAANPVSAVATAAASAPGTARRRTRLSLSVAAILAFTLTAAGCGAESGPADDKASADANATQLGLSLPNSDMEFFQELLSGAREEAKVQDIRLSVRDAESDVQQQGQDLEKFSKQGVGSIVVAPVSSELPSRSLREVTKADIPLVAADRAHEGAVTVVSSDNEPGGQLAADALASALGGEGTVVVLRGPSNTPTSQDRGKGFRNGIKEHNKIKVAATKEADFDQKKAEKVMEGLIADNPSITGVFAENDDMALGAAKALEAWPAMNVKIVGFDGTPSGLKAVQDGTLAATVAQQPQEIGKLAVRNAVRAARGEAVDDRILVPLRVATKANLAEFD